jgi:hypothetical protein
MKYSVFIFVSIIFIFFHFSCSNSDNTIHTEIHKHKYRGSNDSIEQTLELFSLDDSTTQFTLRVEDKYLDSIDGYMSNAASNGQFHYIHNRNNCRIEFSIKGKLQDTALITFCKCDELTLKPASFVMTTDTLQINVFR